jgi:hypothetical protein
MQRRCYSVERFQVTGKLVWGIRVWNRPSGASDQSEDRNTAKPQLQYVQYVSQWGIDGELETCKIGPVPVIADVAVIGLGCGFAPVSGPRFSGGGEQ